jgi:hypothetical protein
MAAVATANPKLRLLAVTRHASLRPSTPLET